MTGKMRAIVFKAFGEKPEIASLQIPSVSDSSVLLKVMATGICRSDWHGWMGHDDTIDLPHVPGHEFAGEIISVGTQVVKWKVGDRVTAPFIQACGKCSYCHRDDHQVCENQEQAGFTYHGSFAEYMEIKHADVNLVRLPDSMSFEVAAVLGCRFGTSFRALVDQARLSSGQKLAIYGAGGVGLSAIYIAKAIGAEVHVMDSNVKALDLAQQAGADYCYQSVTDMVSSTRGKIQVAMDAIGSAAMLTHSNTILDRRGKHIQVGLVAQDQPLAFSLSRLIAYEFELIGSHGIQAFRYQAMIDFVMDKKLPLEAMIAQRLTLDEGAVFLMDMGKNQHAGVSVILPTLQRG